MKAKQTPTLVRVPAGAQALEGREDDELLQLAGVGVQEALAVLIRRHQSALRAYCTRRCGRGLGDDVAQEVFVAVWAQRTAYEPRGKFRAYLFTLAEHRCRNVKRAGARTAKKHAAQAPAPAEPSQLDALLASERQRRLYASLDKLPEAQQRALLLRYAAGLDYDEIAEILARPAATVRTRVFLGLSKLRALLHKRGDP
jgi:RNA polymerase sigma-70 factor (ECF subfamily)